MANEKLTDNEKVYRGCTIGMMENIIASLHTLACDFESCPNVASDGEIDQIYDMAETLRAISNRLIEELKPYGLEVN